MAKRYNLEQKGGLDLPDEIIEDNIMAFLSIQDLYSIIKVGNSRLKDCAHRVIRKRPKDFIIVAGWANRSSYKMSIYFNNSISEVTDVKYSQLPDYPCKFCRGSAINCEGRSIFLVNGYPPYNKLVYEMRNGGYHALPSLNIGRDGSSVCYINKQLVVMGGDDDDARNSIETLSIDVSNHDTEWKISQSSLPIPLYWHQTVEFENRIILTGGVSNRDPSERAWEGKLSPANEIVWKEIGMMNYKRWSHFLFSFQNKVIVFGGKDGSGNESDFVEFLEGDSWKLGPRVPFNFQYRYDTLSVLDRQGRINIISCKHGLVTYDIQKETFKHYPNCNLRESRYDFTALLQ